MFCNRKNFSKQSQIISLNNFLVRIKIYGIQARETCYVCIFIHDDINDCFLRIFLLNCQNWFHHTWYREYKRNETNFSLSFYSAQSTLYGTIVCITIYIFWYRYADIYHRFLKVCVGVGRSTHKKEGDWEGSIVINRHIPYTCGKKQI